MVLLGLVILVCGIMIGSAGTVFVARRAMLHAVRHPEEMPRRAATRLASRLDLTDEQRARIEGILRTRLRKLGEIRDRLRPHMDRELDALREEIADVLDENQERRWREDFRRLRQLLHPPAYEPAPDGSI